VLYTNQPKVNRKLLSYYRYKALEENLFDGMVADNAVDRIKALKDQDRTFFLGVGFTSPHLPFVAPHSYWNLYDPADIQLPAKTEPEGMYPQALIKWSGELNAYQDRKSTRLNSSHVKISYAVFCLKKKKPP